MPTAHRSQLFERFAGARDLLLALILAFSAASANADADPSLIRLDLAQAVLQADSRLAAPDAVKLPLRHNWDKDFPGVGGRASYTLQWSYTESAGTKALLFERVGNQAVIRVNNVVVQELGRLGDPSIDVGKLSHMVIVPPTVLRAGRNELVVEATMQPLRGGGLSPVLFGPAPSIESTQSWLRLRDQFAAAVYATGFLLMGGLAAGLWWRQRDALYGCFSLAAFFGVLRHLDRVFQSVPVPWPLWGAILAIGYGCHLALIARFILLVLGRNPVMLVRAIYGVGVAVIVLAALSFWLLAPALWTRGLELLELVGLACFGPVFYEAVYRRRRMAWILLGAGSLMLLAGVHDIVIVRRGLMGGSSLALTPHAMFFLVLILAGLVVERYSRSVADYRLLNEHLAERVAQRERQLGDVFESLRAQREEQAVLSERQRMMREIHDGIGSHLVGLLNMVSKPQADPRDLEEQVRLALDEMRMAVDSLQPIHSDLITVLATLRYRLQPRLQAAGIEVVWEVQTLPPISDLSPQSVWQVQRILLEAFTNVLKHAHATRVTVDTRYREGTEPAVLISLTDNGTGLGTAPPNGARGGHGMANMHARAAAIGASLSVHPAAGGGTCVAMEWTLSAAASAALNARPSNQ